MADKYIFPNVMIEIDGKARHLCFNIEDGVFYGYIDGQRVKCHSFESQGVLKHEIPDKVLNVFTEKKG